MNNQRKYLICTCAVFLLFSFVNAAAAGLITIQNAGFESNVFSDEGWGGVADGWIVTGNAGTFNPGPVSMPGGNAPEGSNMAFVAGGSLMQTLGSVLTENTTYTLTMDVIKRFQYTSSYYEIELLAGTVVIANDNTGLSLSPGTYATSTISYTVLAGDPLIGSQLGIRLVGDAQTNFDRVALSADAVSAVPVPGAFFLLGAGLISLAGLKTRKRTLD